MPAVFKVKENSPKNTFKTEMNINLKQINKNQPIFIKQEEK